jgi:hypothetical protein
LVLHRLLEQIVSCRDTIAQQYLMECLIQVFPDEFHLATLDTLLGVCTQLQPTVDVRVIISSLMDRLAEYATRAGASKIGGDAHVFNAFYAAVTQLATERAKMPPVDLFALQVSLVGLALSSYAADSTYVDRCLAAAADYLDALASASRLAEAHTPAALEKLRELLRQPLAAYDSLARTLTLGSFVRVARHLPFGERRRVAIEYARAATARQARIGAPDAVATLFANVEPLLRDAADTADTPVLDDEDFAEEQNLAAGLVGVLYADDVDAHFALLNAARKAYGGGGARRIRYTLVPVVFAALALARRTRTACATDAELWQSKGKKLFEFVHTTVTGVGKCENCGELALRLFCVAALHAGRLGFEPVAYEFVARAFALYEEIAKADAQASAITLIIGTLQNATFFTSENYDTLVSKSAQYSAKLVQKPEQARAVYLVSHLFWKSNVRDPKRTIECFPESDHQILTNLGFMYLDEVLGERMEGVERPGVPDAITGAPTVWRGVTLDAASGVVIDWHGLQVATYDKERMCLVYRQPRALAVNAADECGVELVEITEQEWPATDAQGVLLDKSFESSHCGVSIVCTPNHELYVRTGGLGGGLKASTRELTPRQLPREFKKVTAQQLLKDEQERFGFRVLARAPYGIGLSAPDTLRAAAVANAVAPYLFDVSLLARCRTDCDDTGAGRNGWPRRRWRASPHERRVAQQLGKCAYVCERADRPRRRQADAWCRHHRRRTAGQN